MKQLNAIGNLKMSEEDGYALFSVNPKIYSLAVVYSACYILLDRAYIFLDGDPTVEILVEIRKKEKIGESLKKLTYDFSSELINYAVYDKQSEKNRDIRETILKKIILTNDPQAVYNSEAPPKIDQSIVEENIDDPEEILKLWEESENKIKNENLEEKPRKKSKKC